MKNSRKLAWILASVFLIISVQDPARAKNAIRIRIGTAAPKDTLLHDVLKYIKQDWERISNGDVNATIFPGGILGDGPEMVDQARGGMLQAVGLSSIGLSRIDDSIACLAIPMMFRSYEELDYVRDRIGPRLEKKLEEKGFKLLFWADVGWVYTFTKTPARTPDELRKMKLFTSAGDPETEKLYKELGFHVVPLSGTDMIPSLQTGLVDAVNIPPPLALTTEVYRKAPNMIGVKWSPLIAGTVITLKAWEGIPENYRPQMLEAAHERGDEYRGKIRKWAEDSIREMEARGLNLIEPDADTLAIWQREAENSYPKLRGRYTPADLFDEVQRLRNEFRNSKGHDIAQK
jgi:TRAP-type C4-dicarboxylate transport system substrate-binding protein